MRKSAAIDSITPRTGADARGVKSVTFTWTAYSMIRKQLRLYISHPTARNE